MFISEITEGVVNQKKAKEYTISINEKKLISLLTTHCSDALNAYLKSKKGIYKGFDYRFNGKDFYAIDSSQIERKSQNTANFYTLFLSKFSEKWKKFPPRNKSLICSSSIEYAEGYTYGENLYIVFPENGTKIGVCSKKDIWISFKNSNVKNLSEFAKDMTFAVIRWSEIKNIKGDFDYKLSLFLKQTLNDMDSIIDQKIRFSNTAYFKNIDKNTIIYDALEQILDPDKNDFMISDTSQISSLPKNKEVWFSGKCVLVKYNLMKDLLPLLENQTNLLEIETIKVDKPSMFYFLNQNWNSYYWCDTTVIGKIENYNIVQKIINNERMMFSITHNNKNLGYLELDKDRKTWFTRSVVFAKELQGSGLAPKLYSFIMHKLGLILRSDWTQSIGGKSIWKRLAQDPTVNVYAWNNKTKKAYNIDPETLEAEIRIYDSDKEIITHLYSELSNLKQQYIFYKNKSPKNIEKLLSIKQQIQAIKDSIKDEKSVTSHTDTFLIAISKKRKPVL